MSDQHGLDLTLPGCRLHRGDDPLIIQAQGQGLSLRIVLTEGDEIDVFPVQEPSDALRRGAQAVVGGNPQDQGFAVAQVALGRHGNRGVRYAVGQFPQGVSRAGDDRQHVDCPRRAQRLRVPDGSDRGPPADCLQPLPPDLALSEAAVPEGVFAENGDQLETLCQGREDGVQLSKGAVGPGKGQSKTELIHLCQPP